MSNDSQNLPSRSPKLGIGKEIGGAVYLHRQYESLVGDAVLTAKAHLPEDFDYDVVKYNYQTGAVSFVACSDFNTAHEPTVGDIVTVDAHGSVRWRRQPRDPEIYHHKWLFVADDYSGFDVEPSRQRSLAWMQLDGIDRSRIGRRSYWEREVVPRIESSDTAEEQQGGRSSR